MATRTISTRLAVEGESQYKASLTRINGEIKSLQSALKLTESQFQNNANSMAALTAKGDALKNLYTAQAAKVKELASALDNARNSEKLYADIKNELEDQIKANNEALEQLKTSTGDTAAEQERLTAENKELNAELDRNEAYLAASSRSVTSWQDKLNTAQIQLNDLDAELKLNDEYLEEARNSADGCAISIDRFGDRAQSSADKADALRDALMAAGVVAALKATADALEACAEVSIEFESAMAGVSKTTDMADNELEAMGNAIQDLATKIPATATEIANVAEAAGQLGIAKEDILAFSEVMVNLGTATNLSSTEAASALAKFANVVSMSADDYERLGSTIVALGNNFATTEADIVSMATRLSSTGSLVGLTEAEIMAVAAAMSSVGIEAEAGGSAISKLLKQFEVMVQTGSPQLADFASVAGMSADEFAVAWGENAVEALGQFIDGLGAVDKAGGSSVAVLQDLGITEVRLSNAVLSMASSNGLLTKALNLANNAWNENSALNKEAATRYETTESKLQLLSNAADNAKIAIGDQLTPTIGNLAEAGADALNWCADFIDQNEAVVPLVTATAAAVGVLAVGITGYSVASKVAAAATAAFTLVLETNPIFLAVTAVAALTAGLGVLAATISDDAVPSLSDMTVAADSLTESLEKSAAARTATVESTTAAANVAETYISKLEQLEATGLKTDEQQQQYHNTLALLCQIVPDLAQYIDLQNDIIEGGTEALWANTEAWKQNAIQQAYQEQLTELYEEYADVLVEAEKNSIGLTEAEEAAAAAGQKHADALARMEELAEAAKEEAAQLSEEYGYTADATSLLSNEYYELKDSLEVYQQEQFDATATAENYQKAIDKDAKVVKAAKEELALAEKAIKSLTGEIDENTEAMTENADAQSELVSASEETQTQINELAQAYQEAHNAARDSIDGQIGLFDQFTETISADTDTVGEMMQRWQEQTQNLATYTENLAKAAQYGVDEGLVLALSDGSAESAGYIATIIEEIERLGGSTEGMSADAATFVEEFNASFAGTQQAQENFATTVGAMQTDFDGAITVMEQAADNADFSGVVDALDKAFSGVEEDAQNVGNDVTNGLTTGIENNISKAEAAAKSAGQAVIDACRNVLDSHSDSRVMIGVGKDVVGGLVTGIKNRKSELTEAIKDLGEGINDSMTASIKGTVEDSMSEFSQISAKAKIAMNSLKTTISSATSGLSLYSTGQDIVNGMISGLNNRSGALYSTMRSIVNNAIITARSAALVRSPSKKTTEIFEYVGDGMVVGLENRRKKVKDTAQSVVSDALKLDIGDSIKAASACINDAIPNLDIASIPSSSSATTIQHDYGGFEINIHQRDGEDAESLAYRVMDVIQTEFMRKEAAIGV